jgi:Ni,Fe-hydrogenase I large subunit
MKNNPNKLTKGIKPAKELTKEELKKRHKENDPTYSWLEGPLGDALRAAYAAGRESICQGP